MTDDTKATSGAATRAYESHVDQWTRKFGYVVPWWNTVSEYGTIRMLAGGVSAHFSRTAQIA